jgi:iron(III) transport system permease protein
LNLWNQTKLFFKKPHNIILVILVITLAYLTLVPLLSIIFDTVTVHASEVMRIRGKEIGDFTTYHWRKVMFDEDSYKILYQPLLNSLNVSLWPCMVSIFFGGIFAWFITRTNIRFKKALSALFIFPYIMPSWTLALAWLNFFKNRLVGGVPGLFTVLTGIQTPNWFAYGAFPIIIVTGLHYAPFAFILIGGVLRNMDANLEEAALILKTNQAKIMWKITIPIVLPAILSTFLLVFSSSMSSFAVPSFLGLPVRYQVLTTQMYRTLNGLNPGYGYILALIMILLSVLVLGINQRIIGRRKSYTTITGKSANISLVNLRKWRTGCSIVLLVSVLCISILPLISFAIESLILEPGNYSWSNFTTIFWVGKGTVGIANSEPGILRNKSIFLGLWNSIRLSIICSLLAGTVGFLAGYAIVRRRGSKLAETVSNLTLFISRCLRYQEVRSRLYMEHSHF